MFVTATGVIKFVLTTLRVEHHKKHFILTEKQK